MLVEGRSCVLLSRRSVWYWPGVSGKENLEASRACEVAVAPGHWPQAPTAPCGPGAGCPEALIEK